MEYYLGIDVSQLTEEQWAAKYAQLRHIRKQEEDSRKEQNKK